MKKFTVFTVILTVLVVVVVAETVVNKYLPSVSDTNSTSVASDQYNLPNELDLSKALQSNVLGADNVNNTSDNALPTATTVVPSANTVLLTNTVPTTTTVPSTNTVPATTTAPLTNTVPSTTTVPLTNTVPSTATFNPSTIPSLPDGSANSSDQPVGINNGSAALEDVNKLLSLPSSADFDIEDFSNTYEHTNASAYIRDDQVVNSGFVGAYVEAQVFDGFLYKTINIGDLSGVATTKYAISNGTTTYVKIYVLVSEKPENIGDVYNVLKTRAADSVEVVVNETNEFGSASFYMNDSRRNDVAFLTVRIGSYVYGFTYPKQYHPQIKNLISLLMLEGG